jgi:hypothetical protein
MRPFLFAPILALGLAPFAASDARSASSDPAGRGLDVFVHVPADAAPGSLLPVQIEAFGFPTAATLTALGQASVEAGWDPTELGPGVTAAPPSVKATTDASGRTRLLVPVPDGDVRSLQLIVGVRSGSHERTRLVRIQRGPLHTVAVHVADTRVVPGSSVSAWVMVTRAGSGEPAPGAKVELALVEGGVPRQSFSLTTDAAGTAMARVPIPFTDEPTWSWQLRGRSIAAGGRVAGESEVGLRPREETPATPSMQAFFTESAVLAGDRAAFVVRVRDAVDQPVAGLPLRYWVGPKGTEPPQSDEAWARLAKAASTDAEGELHGFADTPTLVVHGVGTTLRLVAKAAVSGHALAESTSVSVGVPTSSAELLPEAGGIVPGVDQHVLLRVHDGHGKPVAASFTVAGDGLSGAVTTNANGEAELAWHPPPELGALRNVGPCAGGVAAAVTVRPVGVVPALAPRTEPFELCVPVHRDAQALVSVDRPMARMGERVHVRVIEVPGAAGKGEKAKAPGPPAAYSLVLRSDNRSQAASVWMEDGEKGADVEVPAGAPGVWSITAASPSPAHAARVASGALVVLPRVLPKLSAKVSGGRAAPGGTVDVDVDLTDEKGQGLPGTVAAVVVDLHGGGSVAGLERIDTRRSVCNGLGVDLDRCDRFVEGDPTLDALRRGLLGGRIAAPLAPERDPGGTAKEALTRTFTEVLRSLEGAVFEASASAERLADVRRKGPRGGFVFNPELMTLVTAAMSAPPETPGGEPLSLADLLTLDPQVTFDNVARRVTRLKLFNVLQQVRAFKRERQLDPDEPIFKDPNALLRRLVRDGRINEDMLLDPWGGTLQFVPQPGAPLPFLTVVRGFELRAPGPDGKAGTADDVRDPFERVVRSGTPYARAMDEDRLVDARYDMEVGDPTVDGWHALLEQATGTSLGGIGLGKISTIGHGSGTGEGFGSGHGRLGGSHRATGGLATGVAWWSPPERTDARGHVRFHVPLGDAETTWRVALLGVPDGAPRASTWVDVPVALPLSARVDAGVTWIEGDAIDAAVTLRNRTGKPVRATVTASASGAARLRDVASATRTVDVAASGAAVVRVPLSAPEPGAAEVVITVQAPDLPDDVLHHAWRVLPAGERTELTRSQWVEGKATLDAALGDRRLDSREGRPSPVRLVGTPRLVLERGLDRPLAAALEAMDPDRLPSREALADAIEVASRIARWATVKQGQGSPTAARAAEIIGRARGRLALYDAGDQRPSWSLQNRLHAWIAPENGERPTRISCPPRDAREEGPFAALEGEPAPESGSALSCWDAAVSSAIGEVSNGGDAVALARAFLALAEHPHRASLAATVIDRLREKVSLRPSGAITLPEAQARERSARAVVFAALLRGVRAGAQSPAPADRLAAWIGVQRDADGGYGSALATREVVRALLDAGLEEQGTSRVTVITGDARREVVVPPSGRVEVPLDPRAVSVQMEVQGPGLVARLERPVVRLWSGPPPSADSPLHLDVSWPGDARAGEKGLLSLTVRQGRGRITPIDVRLPLPPGVSLAEPVDGVRQIQGVLAIRRTLDGSGLGTQIDLPLRFDLAGRMTVPEATIAVAHEEVPRALAPARPLVVR